MQYVRQTRKMDANLVKIEEIEGLVKTTVGFLRNLQKNEPRQDPSEIPVLQKSKQVEKWLNSHQGSSSNQKSSSTKQKWSDDDVDKI